MSNPKRFVVIAGALSSMAQECARIMAARTQCDFLLLGRKQQNLDLLAQDLRTRGANSVVCLAGDLSDQTFHRSIIENIRATGKPLDTVLLAWGKLGNDSEAQLSNVLAYDLLNINLLAPISLLTELLPIFETQKSGKIAVISSVAGDRGRQSNYVYGTAKAGLSTFLQGYRNRLYKSNVDVITIKPGIIKTPMTSHLQHGGLSADAQTAGLAIFNAIERCAEVAYIPWYWQWIMMIIKAIPENVFKRLKL